MFGKLKETKVLNFYFHYKRTKICICFVVTVTKFTVTTLVYCHNYTELYQPTPLNSTNLLHKIGRAKDNQLV